MPEPIYSRRYRKDEESRRAKKSMEFEALGKEKWAFLRGQLRRDVVFGKVVEVTNRNECDVDIFEGNGTMIVKIYFDFPSCIYELDGVLSLATMISINAAKDGHDAVLSIFYDLDAK